MPEGFEASGRFTYSRVNKLDHTLINNSADSLVILYRPDASHNWQPVTFTPTGNWMTGSILVPHLKTGEYTLAIWDEAMVGNQNSIHSENSLMRISPNPCTDYAQIHFSAHTGGTLYLLGPTGNIYEKMTIHAGERNLRLNMADKSQGSYLVQFTDRNGRKDTVKLLVSR